MMPSDHCNQYKLSLTPVSSQSMKASKEEAQTAVSLSSSRGLQHKKTRSEREARDYNTRRQEREREREDQTLENE